jgi:ATP-binding cassette, subfamily B, multidrug efflux pump
MTATPAPSSNGVGNGARAPSDGATAARARTLDSRPPQAAGGGGSPAHEEPVHLRRAREAGALDPEKMTTGQLLRWMFSFLLPVKGNVLLACLYLALFCTVEVLTVRQSGIAVSHMQKLHVLGENRPRFWDWLWHGEGQPLRPSHLVAEWLRPEHFAATAPLRDILLIFVGLTAAMLCFRYLMTVSKTRMSMTMVYYIREAVYDKLQRVGFGYHDALSSGQLINRALSDLQNCRAFVESAVLTTLEIVMVVGGYIVLLMTLSPWVALLSLVPLPIWTWYILRFSKRVQPAAKATLEAEDRNVSIITENIAGVHVVKAFATERQEVEKYEANCETFMQRKLRQIRMFADFQPVIRTIATASYLTLFLAAGVLIILHRLEVGSVLVLGGAMSAILTRLQQVNVINENYQNAVVSARRLYEVIMARPTVPEAPAALPLPAAGAGAVRFEHVTFGYDPAKPVLHDVNFDVPGGSIVAIVGPTGAGKTTLVSLLARYYDPQQGRVLIDGVDVRDAALASLRTQVSFVFQETYLFSDTVTGNIGYGRPGISEGDVEAAARLAQAHEFIEDLKLGYGTLLGERGSSLSGGQRQRLAIARAILTNPRVLILDDATASVDPGTEDAIRRAMRLVMRGRTTFVIAHRISTVKQADVVLVIERGRITQSGTHAELMRQDGHYREIAAVQLYGDEPLGNDEADADAPSHMDRVRDPRRITAAATIGADRGDTSADE